MGLIVEKTDGIETVGELIEALQAFPVDMPIEIDMERRGVVYRVKPQTGEMVDDERGRICIDGDDGTFD
jgi:hypothetical protein